MIIQNNYMIPIPFTNQVHTKGKTNQNHGRVSGKYNMIEITIRDTKKIAQSVAEPFFSFSIFTLVLWCKYINPSQSLKLKIEKS